MELADLLVEYFPRGDLVSDEDEEEAAKGDEGNTTELRASNGEWTGEEGEEGEEKATNLRLEHHRFSLVLPPCAFLPLIVPAAYRDSRITPLPLLVVVALCLEWARRKGVFDGGGVGGEDGTARGEGEEEGGVGCGGGRGEVREEEGEAGEEEDHRRFRGERVQGWCG